MLNELLNFQLMTSSRHHPGYTWHNHNIILQRIIVPSQWR